MLDATVTERWNALKRALATVAPGVLDNLHPGACDEAVKRLRAGLGVPLPPELEALYRENDGEGRLGLDFQAPVALFSVVNRAHAAGANDYWFMPIDGPDGVVAEVAALAEAAPYRADVRWSERTGPVRSSSTGWIPFAKDFGGNFLCIDVDPDAGGAVGQVIEAAYDDSRLQVVSGGLHSYLGELLLRVR
jgi:cell wall assembly regulator SMI1